MQIRFGYELIYTCIQSTPMIVMLQVHHSRVSDLVVADHLIISPHVKVEPYRDAYGNWCSRLVSPPGDMKLTTNGVIYDSGLAETLHWDAHQTPVQDLPSEVLEFLLPSRYCDTEQLLPIAWGLFETAPTGWGRVQAICDFVHTHISFGYQYARSTKTAFEAYQERSGVCRDFAHLAIAFCRCMNIPARYCTGYLGDIGVPILPAPMDFAGWFEVWLDGHWYTFDARNNTPRIGRILMGRGRDAADVALSTTFGPNTLKSFRVWCEEIL